MRSLLAAFLLVNGMAAAHAELNTWKFRVLLDDREIGRHQFTLRSAREERELRSEARFDVRVLFVSVYSYVHEAIERWNGNCLQSLVSRTETNGESQSVSAAVRGNRLTVERFERRDEHEGCVMSFAYWNPQILNAHRLLNSQTGELLPVTVAPQGEETIKVRGQPLTAQRHRLSAPQLTIDLWYAGGEWVALESPAKGGRRLRYELM
ncbi:MAG: DUF6134 family protein [Betaproteobacteria bacterium]|nr:DUF6134 family protein [Betaproteobacteria bacterium]